MKNEYKLRERFSYWLDKRMSKGTVSIIRLLSFAVVFVVVLVTVLILVFHLRDSAFSAFWDSLATIVNAWMPSSDDGEIGYIILNTLTAIVGLFFTSMLIGVISSGIEEKLEKLRKGNSRVLEKDHIVVLGYNTGEHGLLKQLILATEDEKRVIVIFTDIEKPDMETDLENNLDIPDNVEIICRNGDITNVNDLRCCSIDKAKLVIINALNDNNRIKSILAVSVLKKEYPDCNARIVACVTDDKHLLPQSKIGQHKITMFKTDDFMAKIIAHTSTEPGLSVAFKELLNFEENELYFEEDERFTGKTIGELASCVDQATVAGIRRNKRLMLNPSADTEVREDDIVILFEESKGKYVIREIDDKDIKQREYRKIKRDRKDKLLIFGYNVLLETILDQLHDDIHSITLVTSHTAEAKELIETYPEYSIIVTSSNYERRLEALAQDADHIIILIDREMEKEDADVDAILLLLKLMDIKERNNFKYNIAVELNMESSHNVAMKNDSIDYIVGSDIASLVLGQMAENPRLEEVFNELLSKEGNELYSKPIQSFNLVPGHDYGYDTLKQIALSYKYTLFGLIHGERIRMNLPNDERIIFEDDDRLFVLGRH